MLQSALEMEVSEYIERCQNQLEEKGHQQVVRNGYHKPRELTTGIGKIPIRQHRVHNRRKGCQFTSAILPKYARRAPSIDTLIPTLYLKGIFTSSFPEALEAILGKGAPGLSAANIVRLKAIWDEERKDLKNRYLSDKHYAYIWVDGIYFNVRLEPDRPCMLVLVGATAKGKKELVAIADGERESKLSWQALPCDLKSCGLKNAPAVAVGDGGLGFWPALEEEFPTTKHQRCWTSCPRNFTTMPRGFSTRCICQPPKMMPWKSMTVS